MKRQLLYPAIVFPLAMAALAMVSILVPARASAAEPKSRIVSVDYVLALMDAGIGEKEIIQRIEEKNLDFRLSPGDLDRLREAGAGKGLVEVVTARAAELQSEGVAPSGPAAGAPAGAPEETGTDTSRWGRPSRLGGEVKGDTRAAPPAPSGSGDEVSGGRETEGYDDDGEGIEEIPYAGGYGSPGYYDFYYSYAYPYPYYYYPPYSYYYYSYPYRSYHYYSPYVYNPHHGYRNAPRGGSSAPRGGGGGTRPSTPRGGGGSRPAPRGSHHP